MEHSLRRNQRTGLDTAVIFLDLDGFKNVNDGLGHGAGDQLLQEVAARLCQAVRNSDTVARLGGDEFAILIEQSPAAVEESEGVAERILRSLATPVELEGQAVTVSASLGIATSDPDSSATSLLRDADVAMYRAKARGKARWVVYDPVMRSAAMERLQLENDLIGALDGNQLALVYQPVVRLETEEIVGFEALLRWHHPTLGLIAPDRFIPIAEETGLIVPICRWVLSEACATAVRWTRDYPGHRGMTMAVNVSGRQIASSDLVAHVEMTLAESRIDPASLVLEMTETALIQDTSVAAVRLQQLSSLGVRLAIDDFGTGYSSLSYLRSSRWTSSRSTARSSARSPIGNRCRPSSAASSTSAARSTSRPSPKVSSSTCSATSSGARTATLPRDSSSPGPSSRSMSSCSSCSSDRACAPPPATSVRTPDQPHRDRRRAAHELRSRVIDPIR